MTSEIILGEDGEDQEMSIQDKNEKKLNEPVEPDENWWAAVLADEPLIEEESEPVESVVAARLDKTQSERPTSSVNWEKIKKIFTEDEIISLNVVGYNRGGILVADEDVHGFVPSSHLIDVPSNSSEDEREQYFTSYIDRYISLKVIECEPEKERVVFSERAALAGEGKRRDLLSSLNEGDVVSGIVTNVTDFGVFVDLGGLEGLIHVSELSWGRVKHPSNILKLNEEIQVMVLQVAESEGRIALSLKRLEENPWNILAENLTPGDHIEAVISSIVPYGAFARLAVGVEGLIHISSMNFPKGCTHIDEFLYEGQAVNVCVIHVDPYKRRLGLRLVSYPTE